MRNRLIPSVWNLKKIENECICDSTVLFFDLNNIGSGCKIGFEVCI